MEWEKAKSILIAVFFILNVCIFVTGLYVSESRKMTAEDDFAIRKILSESNITIDGEIPADNPPLSIMNLSPSEWDYYDIRRVFFKNAKNVTRTNEAGDVIYRSDDNTVVTVTDGGFELNYFEKEAAGDEKYYLGLLGEPYRSFRLVREVSKGAGKVFLYNQIIDGYAVFPSFLEITLSDDKSAVVKIRKNDFISYVSGAHDIFRADEALLTFLHYKTDVYGAASNVSVAGIQLGYAEDSNPYERARRVKPCYRIFITGEPEPVYIDAIMNTVILP